MFFDNVIGPKKIFCDCVTEDDLEMLVEFIAVTDVVECNVLFKKFDTRGEVAFSVVKSIGCRWCVVRMPAVSNDSMADGSGISVNLLLSKCKKTIYIREEKKQFYKWTKMSPGYELGRSCDQVIWNSDCLWVSNHILTKSIMAICFNFVVYYFNLNFKPTIKRYGYNNSSMCIINRQKESP